MQAADSAFLFSKEEDSQEDSLSEELEARLSNRPKRVIMKH